MPDVSSPVSRSSGQAVRRQLIVIDILRMDGLPVFAFQNTRLRRTIFHNGIRHFKRNVALVTDRDREIHCALLLTFAVTRAV